MVLSYQSKSRAVQLHWAAIARTALPPLPNLSKLLVSRPALASRYAYQPLAQPGFAGAASGYGSEYANYAAASALAAAQQAAVMQQMAAYGGMPGGMPAGMPAVGYGVAMPLSGPMPMSPVPGSPNLFHGHGGGGRQPPLPPPSPSARYSHPRE